MPASDDLPRVTGAGSVKIVILALLLLLIGGKFGVTVSWVHFACAIGMAAIFYALWWVLTLYLSSRWGR